MKNPISYAYAEYGNGRFFINGVPNTRVDASHDENAYVTIPFNDGTIMIQVNKADIFASYATRMYQINDGKISIGLKKKAFPLLGVDTETLAVLSISPEQLRKGYNNGVAKVTASV